MKPGNHCNKIFYLYIVKYEGEMRYTLAHISKIVFSCSLHKKKLFNVLNAFIGYCAMA